jgi:hypothetical protein
MELAVSPNNLPPPHHPRHVTIVPTPGIPFAWTSRRGQDFGAAWHRKWQALSITIFVVQCLPFLLTAIRAAMEYCMRFQLVTVVMMKIKILKNMTPCRLVKSYCDCGVICSLHLRDSPSCCVYEQPAGTCLSMSYNFRSFSDMQTVSEGLFSDLREGRFLKTHNLPVASVLSEAFSLCISHHQETAA